MKDVTDRRSVLRLLATGCMAAVGLPRLIGCASSGDETGAVTLDRADAERAGRTIVTWNDQPVEVRFADGGFEGRSLACTHVGCIVRWDPQRDLYVCPCHEGRFDARGNPAAGPPTEPLRPVPVRVSDGLVIVGS